MTGTLGPVTATFSIRVDDRAPVEDELRAILASRYLEPKRLRTRCFGGIAYVVVEQPGMNEAEALAVLSEVRALGAVRSAELECRLERREPRPRLQLPFGQERIDVV